MKSGGVAPFFGLEALGFIFFTFSPERVFSPMDSSFVDVFFTVPGSSPKIPATTTAFGVVFIGDSSLVEVRKRGVIFPTLPKIEFFDLNDNLIFELEAPSYEPFNFLGGRDPAAQIRRVRITTGTPFSSLNLVTKRAGPPPGLSLLDDFIYATGTALTLSTE